MYRRVFKRGLDIVASIMVIILCSPIMVLITVLLYIVNSGAPFFTQNRPGKDGKIFRLLKFKTMDDRTDGAKKLLPDEYRLTRVGRIIRSTSLDELPQFLNVLKGDMSLIGPRPLLVKYLSLYNEKQARRHEIKPGITGWAQVNGRNAISWNERFELDLYYVENLSFWLDLTIMYLTVKKVLKREGINAGNSATMEAFKGN